MSKIKVVSMVLAAALAMTSLLACGEKEQLQADQSAGQAQSQSNQAPQKPADVCQDPRPEICTKEYRAVCGYGETTQRTYSNACMACADASVKGWVIGPCEGY